MKGVLVVAHGSRAKETEKTFEAVLDMARARIPDMPFAHAYMEAGEKTIETGVSELAAMNVTEIKIVPYFLFMGNHLKQDIPGVIGECVKKFPGINIYMGEPLGADERLADILADRIVN